MYFLFGTYSVCKAAPSYLGTSVTVYSDFCHVPGICSACGGDGQSCCGGVNGECASGFQCNATGTCQTCGDQGLTCCGGIGGTCKTNSSLICDAGGELVILLDQSSPVIGKLHHAIGGVSE
jgi:hypothetical protein